LENADEIIQWENFVIGEEIILKRILERWNGWI
jgi:hypothetical protein